MLRRPVAGVKPPAATASNGLLRVRPCRQTTRHSGASRRPGVPGWLTPTERRTDRAARRHTPVRLPAAKSTRRILKIAAR